MKRPQQHITETTSRKAFENLCPDEWVLRKQSPDYGLDYSVEIFKNNRSTGNIFFVQLKGTEKNVANDTLKISIKLSQLEYYESILLPILFIAYSLKEKKFWGIWINDFYQQRPKSKRQKSIQISFDEKHLIDKNFIDNITKEFSHNIHQKVSVIFSSNNKICRPIHDFIEKWLLHYYNDSVNLETTHTPQVLNIRYIYNNSALNIEIEHTILGKFALEPIPLPKNSDLIRFPSDNILHIPDEFVEILFVLANFLANKNIKSTMTIFKLLFSRYKGKYKNPETLMKFTILALGDGFINDIQEMIEISIKTKKFDDFQFINMALLLYEAKNKQNYKVNYENNLLKAILNIDNESAKGIYHYNLANSYHASGRFIDSFKNYKLAARKEPDYLKREYWWREIGVLLYNRNHYYWSQLCYIKSYRISKRYEPRITVMIADALFYQGKFKKAIKWYGKFIKLSDDINSTIRLKRIIINELIDNNLQIKNRNRRKANDLASKAIKLDNHNKAVEMIEKALTYDPLCGLAWFNLGVSQNQLGLQKGALFSFTTCAIIQDWDTEAWFNAFFLSIQLFEIELGVTILDAINEIHGKKAIDELIVYLKKYGPSEEKDKEVFFKKFKEMLSIINENRNIE